MNSPCTLKINKLRRKNRALLDQLESNSTLLECRLKKLKHTAKTTRRSDKSWENLPPSPLKRKFECWKARNYSGQVLEALHRDPCDCERSSDIQDINIRPKTMEESPIISPAKRTRHNIYVSKKKGSSPRHKPTCSGGSFKTSTSGENTKRSNRDCFCNCQKSIYKSREMKTKSRGEGVTSPSSSDICKCSKTKSPVLHSPKYCKGSERVEKTVEAAKSVLSYSPESEFLKRLKKRSRTLGDMFTSGNIRPCKSVPSANSKDIICDEKCVVRKEKRSPKLSSPRKQTLSEKTQESIGPRELSSRPTTAKSPLHSPRRDIYGYPPCATTKSAKKTRKRVCYRKNCYCRTPDQIQECKSKLPNTKENLEDLIRDLSAEDSPRSSCRQCCCCCRHCDKRRSPPPRAPLLMTDTISSLVDNETDNKYISCGGNRESQWFNELNEFRQSHWFECHAHPSSVSLDSERNWEGTSNHPLGHKCIHKYYTDDRFFARPLNSDHRNNSRCSICNLPDSVMRGQKERINRVNFSSFSKEDDPIIQVTLPLGKCRKKSPRTTSNISSHKKLSQCSSRGRSNGPKSQTCIISEVRKRLPAPSDSLALRYQKGVVKY